MRKKSKVILVEDDLILAKGTAKLLERLGGYQVEITFKCEKIFSLSQAGEVDIILMDINLPGAVWNGDEVSGSDLSRILKSQQPTKNIPIILLTAYAIKSERDILLQQSLADEFFLKPITNYSALIALMEDLISNQYIASMEGESSANT
ncbi:response regulator [Mastigocoleus testarum]|uniref:Response regulator receiver protein n=1 Tax=Mastigocoleus testarum BC008 TaxID=371196 RepID=A0A0V7ZBQ6_9CYAN|nr:response regulator [Mastigocoleus testarum]KST61946.1 response regulator receiver protein [Mastigocoleus testarum BC008]